MTAHNTLDQLRNALALKSDESSDFDLNKGVELPPNRVLRPCGVMVPLIESDNGFRLILTKRSSALKHHPGQISFPGGKVDEGDDGPVGAALREAHEEIGLAPENVEIIGSLPAHETVTSFTITPVLTRVKTRFDPRLEPGEVAEVFSVPLDFVTDVSRFQIQSRHWRGVQRHFYTVPYGPYYIWGATARILRGLAERLSR